MSTLMGLVYLPEQFWDVRARYFLKSQEANESPTDAQEGNDPSKHPTENKLPTLQPKNNDPAGEELST
jgi:hypothetical protein